MCSKEVQLSQLNKLIITYKEIYNPTTDEDIADYNAFVDFIEYAENLKHLPEELLTDDDKQSLQDYNNLPFELEHELINKLKDKIKYIPRNNQKVDKFNHYINTISDVKKRSKAGIPQIDNITATITFTANDIKVDNHKGQIETYKAGEFDDLHFQNIDKLLKTSCYELIPYSSYNIYGCQYVKTCFNTIGKDYEYISPFIDYDLTELGENITFKKLMQNDSSLTPMLIDNYLENSLHWEESCIEIKSGEEEDKEFVSDIIDIIKAFDNFENSEKLTAINNFIPNSNKYKHNSDHSRINRNQQSFLTYYTTQKKVDELEAVKIFVKNMQKALNKIISETGNKIKITKKI